MFVDYKYALNLKAVAQKSPDGHTTNVLLLTDFFHMKLIKIWDNRVRWLSWRVPGFHTEVSIIIDYRIRKTRVSSLRWLRTRISSLKTRYSTLKTRYLIFQTRYSSFQTGYSRFPELILEFSDSILEFSGSIIEFSDSILEFSDSIHEFSDSILDTWTKVDLADIIPHQRYIIKFAIISIHVPDKWNTSSVLLWQKINYFFSNEQ